jgi:hypothetical protein
VGLNVAFEEILVEAWTKVEGKKKDIEDTFHSIKSQIKEAIKEIKRFRFVIILKNYNLSVQHSTY